MAAIGAKGEVEPYKIPDNKIKKYLEKKPSAHLAIIPTEKIMPNKKNQLAIINSAAKKFNTAHEQEIKAKKIHPKPIIKITADQRKMYEVVVRRSLSIWQKPYTYVSNKLVMNVNDIEFSVSNSVPENYGFKSILPKKKDNKQSKAKIGLNYSKYLHKGEVLPISMKTLQGKTVPPKPLTSIQIFDKGGLMKKAYKYVENKEYAKILKSVKGLGTSATRDTAMQSLQDKGYISVDKKDEITVTGNGWLSTGYCVIL